MTLLIAGALTDPPRQHQTCARLMQAPPPNIILGYAGGYSRGDRVWLSHFLHY